MTNIEIPPGALEQIVGPVFDGMFGLGLEQIPDQGPIGAGISASIRIKGDWEGLLCVETTAALAAYLAKLLLALQEPPPPIDARDALAEITNTIAGNFKSAFTPGAKLALPCIGNPSEGIAPDEAVSYLCGASPLRVTRYSA